MKEILKNVSQKQSRTFIQTKHSKCLPKTSQSVEIQTRRNFVHYVIVQALLFFPPSVSKKNFTRGV